MCEFNKEQIRDELLAPYGNSSVVTGPYDVLVLSIHQANPKDRQVHTLLKSMSHDIKEDSPAALPPPNMSQVSQNPGHVYMSELAIAQEDLLTLSHRLQTDRHIKYPWYQKNPNM